MADLRPFIQALVARGVDPIEAGQIIASAAMEAVRSAAEAASESAEDRKRRIKRENNQRAYEARRAKEERLNAPEKDLKAPESLAPEMHLTAPESGGIQVPLARVEDKLTTTEIAKVSVSSLLDASDVKREDLDALEKLLRSEASPALNQTSPRLCIVAPILALLTGKTGPPCDLQADVLPVIRSKAKSARPNSITGWDFYRPAILEARDKRLQSNPEVIPLDEHRPNHPRRDAKLEHFADIGAAQRAACRS